MRAQRFQPGPSAAASGPTHEPCLHTSGPLAPRNPGFRSPTRVRRFRSSAHQVLALGLIFLATHLLQASAADASQPFRVGFSSRMFFEVNENDAKAAVKVWGQAFTRAQNIPTDPEPFVYDQLQTIQHSLISRQVDAVGLSLTEFDQLARDIRFDPIFVTHVAGKPTEQYLVLARHDGPVKTLADLRGRTLHLQSNLRATLAPVWLDVALVQQGHPIASLHAGRILPESKLTKVVLPVFFRQSDACLVTRTGFDIMNELNPQIGKQLVMVASSPDFVPAVFALRADYQPTFRSQIIEGLRQLHQSPGGQQILTIFQSDAVELRPPSFLDASLELLRTHARLCGTETSQPVVPTASTFTDVRAVPATSDRQQKKGQP